MYKMNVSFEITDRMICLLTDFAEYMAEIAADRKSMPMAMHKESSFSLERRAEKMRYDLLLSGYALSLEQAGGYLKKSLEESGSGDEPENGAEDRSETDPASAFRVREIRAARNMADVFTKERGMHLQLPEEICRLHSMLFSGIVGDAGHFRTKDGIPEAMSSLCDWYRKSSMQPLLRSLVFSYELLRLQPFSSGNDITAWVCLNSQLERWRDILSDLSYETFLYRRKNEYLRVMDVCARSGSPSAYIEFMLRILYCALQVYDEELHSGLDITQSMQMLLDAMEDGKSYTTHEMMELVNLKHRPTFRDNYLLPCMEGGLIVMTVPDKPNSRNQRYKKL